MRRRRLANGGRRMENGEKQSDVASSRGDTRNIADLVSEMNGVCAAIYDCRQRRHGRDLKAVVRELADRQSHLWHLADILESLRPTTSAEWRQRAEMRALVAKITSGESVDSLSPVQVTPPQPEGRSRARVSTTSGAATDATQATHGRHDKSSTYEGSTQAHQGRLRYPRAGEHLVTPRTLYVHHGLSLGDGSVIHRTGPGDAVTDGTVCIVGLDEFAGGRSWRIKPHPNRRYSAAESVQRARSKDGEVAHNVAVNNCEHFVNWCIEGEHRSEQVERAVDGVKLMAETLYRNARPSQIPVRPPSPVPRPYAYDNDSACRTEHDGYGGEIGVALRDERRLGPAARTGHSNPCSGCPEQCLAFFHRLTATGSGVFPHRRPGRALRKFPRAHGILVGPGRLNASPWCRRSSSGAKESAG